MAFMVPVVKKEWDIYGSSAKSRREQQQRANRSRTTSETSQGFSRGPSFSSRPAGSLSSSPAGEGWPMRAAGSCRQSRSSSRASNLSQTAGSPPARSVSFAPRSQPSPPKARSPAPGGASSFSGFHTKVVDKMMRALHLTDKDGSRKA
ncbi:uncharacterized protein LOC119094039 [Pollicipes pollicipes]|uniref:uncharacterized protein LOC119094039 n=1 Tax=Pollicipes pollicipes TaxID=41117 RepID=UPI00188542B0|nr:uncharacterized protein LOC119094039 [Pollicipes pollicipes]